MASNYGPKTYDREVSHIFAAQDEIALAVASALQVKLLSANSAAIPATPRTTKFQRLTRLIFRGSTSSPRGQDREDLTKALAYSEARHQARCKLCASLGAELASVGEAGKDRPDR